MSFGIVFIRIVPGLALFLGSTERIIQSQYP